MQASSFSYSPQDTIFESLSLEENTLLDYSSESLIDGERTEFNFFKNDAGSVNTTGLYMTDGPGIYYCQMANTEKFPDLTLITAPVTITGGTGIENLMNNSIQAYPNPVSDLLFLDSEQDYALCKIAIYTIEGIKFLDYENLTFPFELDMRHFKRGIYLVKVITPNYSADFKILKE